MTSKPLAIFYEHPDWFRPLFKELDVRGINYVKLDASYHSYDPAAARRCRLAWLVYLFGGIILLSGLVLLFLGAGRLDEIINWFAARSDLGLRSAYVVDVIIGAVLIFAGSKRR
jgi:hypothetical protein